MPKHQKQTSLIIIPSIFFSLTVLFCSKKNYVFAATPDQIEIATSMEKASFYPYGTQSKYDVIFEKEPNFISQQFDFPVGIPDGSNYYKAREFGQKRQERGDIFPTKCFKCKRAFWHKPIKRTI